jgi:hypothetical protein
MSREPEYRKINGQIDPSTRIISVPNGLWQLQSHTGEKGSKEYSPWFNRGPATDHDTAAKSL